MDATVGDITYGAVGAAGLALLLAVVARCCISFVPAATLTALHLQESLLPIDNAQSVTHVMLPATKLLPCFLSAICYILTVTEAVRLGLEGPSWPPGLRLLSFLMLGVAVEVESSIAPPHGARLPRATLYRLRAALRFVCAAVLAISRLEPPLARLLHAMGAQHSELSAGDPEPDWEPDMIGGIEALLAAAFLLAFFLGPPTLQAYETPPPPMRTAWLLPKLLYTFWLPTIWQLMRTAQRREEPIGVADLPTLEPAMTASAAWATGETLRTRRESARRRAEAKPRLFSEMWRVMRVDASLQFAWCCCVLVVEYAAPFGMMGLIGYIGDSTTGEAIPPKAFAFGAAVALGPLMLNACHGQANASGWRFGVKLRAYITRAVCEKALRFDASATDQSIGQMTNLLAVDTQNIVQFAGFAAWLWLEGMQMLCTLGALFWILGPAAVGGLAVCLFAFPVNAFVMRRVKVLQEKLMKQKDKRMALITECINAIRAIKLHAWEDEFEARIAAERKKEVATLFAFQRLNAVTSTLWLTQPTIAGLASFLLASRAFPPYRITAAQGFTSLTLFQLLSVSLTFLPYVINTAIQANVGLQRISRFLSLDDVDGRDDGAGLCLERGEVVVRQASFAWKQPPPSDEEGGKKKSKRGKRASAVEKSTEATTAPLLASAVNGTSTATPHPATPASATSPAITSVSSIPAALVAAADAHAAATEARSAAPSAVPPASTLTEIEVSIKPGELVLICGPTGCGKSSLLNALLGDIPRLSGRAALSGKVSYCPQRAWLANAPLRDNIVFGAPFDSTRYEAVLDACALRDDLKLLPAGDATEIGEKGINLSGGQQQRVNLARACYADSDIVILDDVLSAVDAHVGAHLFDQCILGLLSGRTRVLVTHSTTLAFSRADHIVVMDQGRVLASGPPTSAAPEIQTLARQAISNPSSRGSSRVGSTLDLSALPPSEVNSNSHGSSIHGASGNAANNARKMPRANGNGRGKDTEGGGARGGAGSGTIVTDEERARGAAKLSTYLFYLRAAGGLPFAAAFCSLLGLYSTMNPLQSIALKSWMASMEGHGARSPASTNACLIYLAAALGLILLTLCRNIILPCASVAASRKLHGGMMRSVMRAPISWYEATPLGRILNRFSADIAAIDQSVASQFKDVVVFSFNVVAIALICSLGTGHAVATATVLAAVACASILSYLVYSVYRTVARYSLRGREPLSCHAMLWKLRRSMLPSPFSSLYLGMATNPGLSMRLHFLFLLFA
uniref:ATP-dependent transporter ycf16 n=1 Tax=Haptolina brevifila TaxID=156173 RepID=A0A7S2IV57_9EUKA